jgi:hypothetical protein
VAKTTARKVARKTWKGEVKSSAGADSLKLRKLNPKPSNASTGHGKVSKRHARKIGTKKIHRSDGTVATVFTVRVGSRTFGSDLRHAFTKSVAKARKENKQKLGVRDYRAEHI